MIGLARGTVSLVDYDDSWPHEFASEQDNLATHIGGLPIEHIGSTAVPRLAAKPIIDLMIGVRDIAQAAELVTTLVPLGYHYMPERVTSDEIFMPKGDEILRTHYLHIVPMASQRWRDTLAFRDYLRTHADARTEYARLKRQLTDAYADDRYTYTEQKSDFIRSVLRNADVNNTGGA